MRECFVEEKEQETPWLYSLRGAHDLLCKRLANGCREAVAAVPQWEGCKILDLGIGTGRTIPHYRKGTHVVGIDPSATMLRKAEKRIRKALAHVTLMRMSGEKLCFPDEFFDAVVIVNVLSVVGDARRQLQEVHRVVRTGGSAVIVNAFHQENQVLQLFAKFLSKKEMTRLFGFHTELEPEVITQAPGWRLVRQKEVRPSQLFVLEKV